MKRTVSELYLQPPVYTAAVVAFSKVDGCSEQKWTAKVDGCL